MDLDEVDRRLLALLQEDARRSLRELARLSGVSTPTASAKVARLEALGVIVGYHARLDPAVLGRTGHVLEVETRPAAARALAARLAALPGVEEVLELAGGRLHARLHASGPADLPRVLESLHAMDEVQTYRVHTVLSGRGAAQPAEAPASVAVACHECKGPVHGSGVHRRWDEDGGKDHWFCCRNCAATFEARLLKVARASSGRPRKA